MIPLECSLNGGYKGLYGEVVTEDCYRLKQLSFVPDYIFDIGANVGIFTRYAKGLFPNARIVAVEPHAENCAVFRQHTPEQDALLMEYALGYGPIFHGTTACNGSGETYLSAGLGYPEGKMVKALLEGRGLEASDVPALTLYEIVSSRTVLDKKIVIKIDCEGAENTIWNDSDSMKILHRADYIAMELHNYALDGQESPKVIAATKRALRSLERTHICNYELNGVHFWATRKDHDRNQIPA